MGKLIYSMITSLDGYVNDHDGKFGWAEPDTESHAFINERSHSIGTYLYGRRMYQMMVFWETFQGSPDMPPPYEDYARIWRAADKIVYSTTLDEPASARTRIERDFDPEAVRRLKAESELDISIDGPTLAAQAIRAGLVDEYALYVAPVIVGGGNPFFPQDVPVDLKLLEEQRLGSGMMYLRYGVRNPVQQEE